MMIWSSGMMPMRKHVWTGSESEVSVASSLSFWLFPFSRPDPEFVHRVSRLAGELDGSFHFISSRSLVGGASPVVSHWAWRAHALKS